jgi:hypothetical protein
MEKELEKSQVDELIPMGKCHSCKTEWFMTIGERAFFQKLIAKKEGEGKRFSMPTHCQSCRESKRTQVANPEQIIARLEEMARKAFEGGYNFEDDKLTDELRSLVKMMRSIYPKRKTANEEQNTESVGQSAASGGDQIES